MKIYQTVTKIPGGLMVVPLFLGILVNTFFPHLLKIGGFTEALSSAGYPTALGMYLFVVGTKMTLNAAPRMLKRGFGIMAAKLAVAMGIAFLVAKIFDGSLFGFSTLALMVAMSDTNGGMFLAQLGEYRQRVQFCRVFLYLPTRIHHSVRTWHHHKPGG